MEDILWDLREHSAGLNCGVWDYSASFVSTFGARPEFVLPDRSKYVNMNQVDITLLGPNRSSRSGNVCLTLC